VFAREGKMGLLDGRTALIFGVANDRSLAWGIAQALAAHGATLAFTYAADALERRVRPLAAQVGATFVERCDVQRDDELDAVFARFGEAYPRLDLLVHAVAFARREELQGRYADTTREGFQLALDVSAYSLVALARRAAPLMRGDNPSILTLTFDGARRTYPHYNVMGVAKAALEASVHYLARDLGPDGIRVNAISAGPVRTLASSGIRGFHWILDYVAERAPLRRNIGASDVGDAAVYLASDLARNVTGQVLYVDAGYHILGAELGAAERASAGGED
jgi:enoyl-[acyl-carrier protein] reductase I